MQRNSSIPSKLPALDLSWLEEDPLGFPPTHSALADPSGLLAQGGDLSLPSLIYAYAHGIFPWFNDCEPVLWWSPSPRCVLYPGDMHVSRSLKKHLRRCTWEVKIDCDFQSVIQHCAKDRAKQSGTWINRDMKEAYAMLHELGIAHSVEVYDSDTLVGGLYGVALGPIFFGESMFSDANNASKTAFFHFSRWLKVQGFQLIDCQVENPHLLSLGATSLDRAAFEGILTKWISPKSVDTYLQIWRAIKGQCITNELSEQSP